MLVAAIIAYVAGMGVMWGFLTYACRETNSSRPLHVFVVMSAIWPITLIASIVVGVLPSSSSK